MGCWPRRWIQPPIPAGERRWNVHAEHQHQAKAIGPRLTRRDEKLNEQLVPLFDPSGRLFLASDGAAGITGQVIWNDARANISELAFARRALIAPHSNPNTTLFIVVSGGGWVQVGDERVPIKLWREGKLLTGRVPTGSLGVVAAAFFAIDAVTDKEILTAYQWLAEREGARTDLVASAHSVRILLVTLLVPIFETMRAFGLLNSYTALVLPYIVLNLPVCTLVLVSFFQSIPRDLENAAMIDGCSRWGAFWRVAMPAAVPGLTVAKDSGVLATGAVPTKDAASTRFAAASGLEPPVAAMTPAPIPATTRPASTRRNLRRNRGVGQRKPNSG